MFQRIWSGRVTTERSAWELLSFVDQIHLWGVTIFRDFVMRHLRSWHDFAKKCYINDVDFMVHMSLKAGRILEHGEPILRLHESCLVLPEWTKHFPDDIRLKLKERLAYHLQETWATFREVRTKEFPSLMCCAMDDCGSLHDPGYPLATTDEYIMHLREVHGADDADVTEALQAWEERPSRQPSIPLFEMTADGDLQPTREYRKRGPVYGIDNIKASKRRQVSKGSRR